MKYKYNLTEGQNIAIANIFPCWTMGRDGDGNIVIYPNLKDEIENIICEMKEYTIILDDDELDVLITTLKDTLHQPPSDDAILTIRRVLTQIQNQKADNRKDYE